MKSSDKTSQAVSKKVIDTIRDARYWDSPQFKLVSDFEPKGSQPQAIEKLVEGLEKGGSTRPCLG